ncbi:proteasome endopeptidase complex beta subunit [Tamaricihabitans halophyticus]|uniref:Proteasome subunit beta n=1 Tax=Tamaricihabitans halophyticus TaxID=1262583 RepID=A0A4R2QN49_9PSEU|nr:proteasome subunit beta [Tamaricihabitans halophyticus]TCP50877.1 proteasome endopeptidase complex beta subunit [Tamaricihabitans halophyticus]
MDNTAAGQSSSAPFGGRLPAAYFAPGTSSFTEFLRSQAPELLPGRRVSSSAEDLALPHGTTIVALTFAGGVLIAGDRRATAGNLIAQRDIEKVYVTDDYSAVGIAGTAGIAIELVRLYGVELAHYEKIEGVSLSLDGKTNKLAAMVRSNLDAALAGLAVLPLFVGYDQEASDPTKAGRIVTFDATGGRYEENAGYHAIGSGSLFAKSALKKLYDPAADEEAALRTVVEALYDAADDDTATGGADLVRRIFPTVISITGEHGAVQIEEERTSAVAETLIAERSATSTG